MHRGARALYHLESDAELTSLQPVSLIPLMKGAAHVTFIGDHMQLPAVVTVRSFSLFRAPS